MAKYECTGCGALLSDNDPPHLCARIRKRYERQDKAVALVVSILRGSGVQKVDRVLEEIALDIVKGLAGHDLGM